MKNILYFQHQNSLVNSCLCQIFLPSFLHRPGFCKVSWLQRAPQWIKYIRRCVNCINDWFRTCYHFKVQVTLLSLPRQMTYHKAKLKNAVDESTVLYLNDFVPINFLLFLGDSCLDHSPPLEQCCHDFKSSQEALNFGNSYFFLGYHEQRLKK